MHFLFSTLIISTFILFGCTPKNGDQETDSAEEKRNEIRIIGRQFYWTIWYPGEDGIFGKNDKDHSDEWNLVGLDYDDPSAQDDKIVRSDDFRLIVGEKYTFSITSWDVIHGAYFPHFRAQTNALPGHDAILEIRPSETTAAYLNRQETNNEETSKGFILICNNVCGAFHNTMSLPIIVENAAEFNEWYRSEN